MARVDGVYAAVLAGLTPHASRAPDRDRDDSADHDADDKPRVVLSLT